jgi:hypothetical protein
MTKSEYMEKHRISLVEMDVYERENAKAKYGKDFKYIINYLGEKFVSVKGTLSDMKKCVKTMRVLLSSSMTTDRFFS